MAKDILDTRFSIDPTTGRVDPDRIGTADISEVFQSIVLPLVLNYRAGNQQETPLLLAGGFELGYVFKQRHVTDSSVGGQTEDTENGQEITTLVARTIQPGTYSQTWNAQNSSSGIYLYRLSADGLITTKRMVLVK